MLTKFERLESHDSTITKLFALKVQMQLVYRSFVEDLTKPEHLVERTNRKQCAA
jgi:hypothetical protein